MHAVQIAMAANIGFVRPFVDLIRSLSVPAIKDNTNRPVALASLLVTGGRFPKILDFFQGLKIKVPDNCLGETLIFKIMIDDVTLW